ncbi:MAG TPA: hypothetical protein VFK13_12540 [Gemmatimonadaceae bacterium]|nr:hypothetical protein [Gemmatimonadaceae bacterium]
MTVVHARHRARRAWRRTRLAPSRPRPWARSRTLLLVVMTMAVTPECGRSAPAAGRARGGAPGRRAAAECDTPHPGWIWCDDFERDRLRSYFEYDDAHGAFTRAEHVGVDGSIAMRARFDVGRVSAGSLHLAFGITPSAYMRPVDAGTARYDDLYWRVYLRLQPGWTGGGGHKLSRALILATPQWGEAAVAPVWSGSGKGRDYLVIDPASGTAPGGGLRSTRYNDNPHLRYLGLAASHSAIFADAAAGAWHCIEAHVRLNDPARQNGVFELWIDGAPEARRDRLDWRGSFTEYGLNALFVENYWNGGAPARQERYIDNVVVSTRRIGCVPGLGSEATGDS